MKYGSAQHISGVQATMAKCQGNLKNAPKHAKAAGWKRRIAEYEKLLEDLRNPSEAVVLSESDVGEMPAEILEGARVDVPVGKVKGKGSM